MRSRAPGSEAGRPGILLVGHGSEHSSDSGMPVRRLAASLGRTGEFAGVAAAFWKEQPTLREGLALLETRTVVVVPAFMADGYYTRVVVPRELGLDTSPLGARRVLFADPVGARRSIDALVLGCAEEVVRAAAVRGGRMGWTEGSFAAWRRSAALVLVGHGTPRSPTSGDTTKAAAGRIAAMRTWRRVACGFLDEAPRIADIIAAAEEPEIVIVPFFIADGWHTRTTLPEALGLTGDRTERGQRVLWYARAVGTRPELVDVAADSARSALANAFGARGEPGGAAFRRVGDRA